LKGAETLHVWEFVHARSGVREHWLAQKERASDHPRIIAIFIIYGMHADARNYSFNFAADKFHVVEE
jgi:hypothetical protein